MSVSTRKDGDHHGPLLNAFVERPHTVRFDDVYQAMHLLAHSGGCVVFAIPLSHASEGGGTS